MEDDAAVRRLETWEREWCRLSSQAARDSVFWQM